MIVVTGGAGFIGSNLIGKLNSHSITDIIVVDNIRNPEKDKNLRDCQYLDRIDRTEFFSWLKQSPTKLDAIVHLGARTNTLEQDWSIFEELNLEYSKKLWSYCSENAIPFIYASSAAVYGDGKLGFSDDHSVTRKLRALNPYGQSKLEFDHWAIRQRKTPPFWAGLRFFNVFGPNELHKGPMASMIYQAYHQIKQKGSLKLFRSHNPDFKDGEQMRDFIYVDDVIGICLWLMQHRKDSGLYNVGSGKARTFIDLAKAVFKTLDIPNKIDFIDIPEDIRARYQYYTKANMDKIRNVGYEKGFLGLEEGVRKFVNCI
ncbi:MAG: ADP-glyceromanno-heptose 6-epimerase [Bacteroidetes bacterium]|nr:ADP-glyceromanno-heptose 6-epimerase [Bacteroidota bacterium]MDA1121749.1 ADP-glyceromanno-heptose 6-epimerase [Bacteroidota bacterium]